MMRHSEDLNHVDVPGNWTGPRPPDVAPIPKPHPQFLTPPTPADEEYYELLNLNLGQVSQRQLDTINEMLGERGIHVQEALDEVEVIHSVPEAIGRLEDLTREQASSMIEWLGQQRREELGDPE